METATPAPPEIAAQLDGARAALAALGADQAALAAGFEAAQAVAALTLDADLATGTMLHQSRLAGSMLLRPPYGKPLEILLKILMRG